MIKIGMLTFHDTTNFGSWLQTYALYKKVKELGYNVEVIDYECEGIVLREKLTKARLNTTSIDDILLQLKKQRMFGKYIKKYLKLSGKKYSRNSINKVNNKYDAFLLGSDLVWDLNITYDDTAYLFDFLEANKPRVAYAASSGRDTVPSTQREVFKKYLSQFNAITVREKGMVSDIGDIIEKEIYHVCDPTLLLKCEEWIEFVDKKPVDEKYILIYFVDGRGNLSRIAKNYARKNNLRVLAINKDFNISKDKIVKPTSIREFLTYIYYAEKIFTSSYHGMMFSLIFNKQFSFFPFAPATRMQSVSDMFGLGKNNIEAQDFSVDERIDYDRVNVECDAFREGSVKRLSNILRELG